MHICWLLGCKRDFGDMNKLASDGWEIYQRMSIPECYQISIFHNPVSGFNDGDSISMASTMRLLFKK